MIVIRFKRVGKKNQPSFKIVVVDKRWSSTAGKFIEEVGFYNPLTKETNIKKERVLHWLSKGVKPSPSILNLLIEKKVVEGKKTPSHKKSKKAKEEKEEPLPVKEPAKEAAEKKAETKG